MKEQNSYDPFMFAKELYDYSESYWSKIVDESIGHEDFSAMLGKMLDMNLLYKKMIREYANTYLNQMNLPSKEDIANVASLVVNTEAKVDDLEVMVEDTQRDVKLEVAELRKEVKDLTEKITTLTNIIEMLTSNPPSRKAK
ncbi:polyhydroxyalkanoic acid synthase subunit PhaR [Anaerobacillus sp. MEB173]|uniref:polyhydroxyalkanoic acid synthase subunit PhaR n=1 Tax=Anaerobacillus sp. MEB173 TaxID=3383345 RepID=UPI003F937A41